MNAKQKAAIARANPQTSANPFLKDDIQPEDVGYVAKDSVASLYSPAAYLTELYRQARDLHLMDTPQRLDVRRPDLQQLILSDTNMNSEVSTLTLSNAVLKAATGNPPELAEELAKATYPTSLPYHAPFNAMVDTQARLGMRASALFDPVLGPEAPTMAAVPQSALDLNLSPSLHALLSTDPLQGGSTRMSSQAIESDVDDMLSRNLMGMDPQDLLRNLLIDVAAEDVTGQIILLLDSVKAQDLANLQNLVSNLLILIGPQDQQNIKNIHEKLRNFYAEFNAKLKEEICTYLRRHMPALAEWDLKPLDNVLLALDSQEWQALLRQLDIPVMRRVRLGWVLQQLAQVAGRTLSLDAAQNPANTGLSLDVASVASSLERICMAVFPIDARNNPFLSPFTPLKRMKPQSREAQQSEIDAQLLGLYGMADVQLLSQVATLCQVLGISRDRLNQALASPPYYQSGNVLNQGNAPMVVLPSLHGACYINSDGGSMCAIDDQLYVDLSEIEPIPYSGLVRDPGWYSISDLDSSNIHAPIAPCDTYLLPPIDKYSMRFMLKVPREEAGIKAGESVRIMLHAMAGNFFFHTDSVSQWIDISLPVQYELGTGKILYLGEITIELNHPAIAVTSFTYRHNRTSMSSAALLRLGKILRLMDSTQASPAVIDRVAVFTHYPDPPELSEETLINLAEVKNIMATRGLTEQEALVLVGCDIDDAAQEGQVSQFDQLFNTPPLNGIYFICDGGEIDCDPENASSMQQRAVLKRAFGVNDQELLALAVMAGNQSSVRGDLPGISLLYLFSLLARCNGWSPLELQVAISVNPACRTVSRTSSSFRQFLKDLFAFADWLTSQKLTVAQMDSMTTPRYSNEITPQIDNFVQSLYQAGQNSTKDNLKDQLAPPIASTFGLKTDQARSLEDWIESIAMEQELELTTIEQWHAEIKKYQNQDPSANPAAIGCFCQALAQLSVIAQNWHFSGQALEVVANYPSALHAELSALSPTVDNLRLLSGYRALLDAADDRGDALLAQLKSGSLSMESLSSILNVPVETLYQADMARFAMPNVSGTLSVTGRLEIGEWLTAEGLTITNESASGASGFLYQWYRSSSNNTSDGTVILEAASDTYQLTASEHGQYVYVTAQPDRNGAGVGEVTTSSPYVVVGWAMIQTNGAGTYTHAVSDTNWTDVLLLPSNPATNDKVVVVNNSSDTTRISIIWKNGDGIPIKTGEGREFSYSNWDGKYLKWGYSQHISNLSSDNPCHLPSFNGGYVYFDMSNTGTRTLIMPVAVEGSVYKFGLSRGYPVTDKIYIETSDGAPLFTMVRSFSGDVFASFNVVNGQWEEI